MSIADKFIQSGSHKNILVVGAELHSKGLDRTPAGRNVSVLFGDGAGAVVMSRRELINEKRIQESLRLTCMPMDHLRKNYGYQLRKCVWRKSHGSPNDR